MVEYPLLHAYPDFSILILVPLLVIVVGDRGARVGALAGCGGVGRTQEAALVRAWGGSHVGGDAALLHRKKEEEIIYLAPKQISLSYLALKILNFLFSVKLKFSSVYSTAIYFH